MSLDGRWEGKLVDVTGVSGVITLTLKERRGKVEGDYSVYFLSQEGSGCCGPERQLVQSGIVSGKYDAGKRSLTISYPLSVGGKPAQIQLDATLRAAMPHARQALFGCYGVDGGLSELTVEGGGIVLWQYA
jgi:hypothetical protein